MDTQLLNRYQDILWGSSLKGDILRSRIWRALHKNRIVNIVENKVSDRIRNHPYIINKNPSLIKTSPALLYHLSICGEAPGKDDRKIRVLKVVARPFPRIHAENIVHEIGARQVFQVSSGLLSVTATVFFMRPYRSKLFNMSCSSLGFHPYVTN